MADLSVRDALVLRDLISAALDGEFNAPLLVEGSARRREGVDDWLAWLDAVAAPLPPSIRRLLNDDAATSATAAQFIRAELDKPTT